MKNDKLNRNNIILIIILFIVFCLALFIAFSSSNKYDFEDVIKYKGKTYGLLEYNGDIFTYNYNGKEYLEEEKIHVIKHDKWKVIYLDGDLFILDKQVNEGTKYYSNDDNYEWFIVFDIEDNELKKGISINEKELDSLYNLDNEKREKTIVFDDIEMFADVLKVSKDGFVQGITTIAMVDGNWYYKTEVMEDETREYVIPILDSLNQKINSLLENK
jgi:hypothetical protein